MIEYKEDKSLIEVRQWKEAVYRDTKDLSPSEFLKHTQLNTARLKEKFSLVNLRKVSSASHKC